MTVSASLAKQSSMPRTRLRRKNHIINYNNQIHHIHYSTMNFNDRNYLRNAPNHFQYNVDINSATSTRKRYQWHNQTDEIALQSFRNDPIKMASSDKMIHSNCRSNNSNRKQQHLNQLNNNLIIEINHHKNNDQYSTDQINGNHYPNRFYH